MEIIDFSLAGLLGGNMNSAHWAPGMAWLLKGGQ